MFKALYYGRHMKTEIVKSVLATIGSTIMRSRFDMVLEEGNSQPKDAAVATSTPAGDVKI